MRNIRVIIAFLSIYLFVGAVVLLGLFAVWLSHYYPDSSNQSILTIRSTMESTSENAFAISKNTDGVTALSATVTRISEKEGNQEQIARIISSTVFVDFTRVTFSEKLVPLGYFSMASLRSVRDANGKIIFETSPDILDHLFELLLGSNATTTTESLSFVAKDRATSYTVQNTITGIKTHEN